MLSIISDHKTKLYAVYTDVLGLWADGSPKLLGHVRYNFFAEKWYVEPYCFRFPTLSWRWHVADRKSGFKSFVKLERKLLAAMQ